MTEVNQKECVVCNRRKVAKTEGRIIDGTWFDDAKLPSNYKGKWVCCNKCYETLVKTKTVNGKGT